MANTTCWRDGCDDRKKKWGMCEDHHLEWTSQHQTPKKSYGLNDHERLWRYVARGTNSECWPWLGALDINGYGVFNVGEAEGGGQEKAHRYAYKRLRGEIPEKIDGQKAELDHTCRVRPCCNPWHLEAVTQTVNTLRGSGLVAENARKTHCDAGHEYTPENTLLNKQGWRRCKICTYAYNNAKHSKPENLAKRREKYQPKTGMNGRGAYQLERRECPEGHPYEGDNLLIEKRKRPDGTTRDVRRCRICVNAKARSRTEKKDEADGRRSDEACRKGHPRSEENTVMRGGKRRCRICLNETSKASYHRKGKETRKDARAMRAERPEKSECPQGHPYAGDNLMITYAKRPDGAKREVRRCRTCWTAQQTESQRRRRAKRV
jgi:hypothetical protein